MYPAIRTVIDLRGIYKHYLSGVCEDTQKPKKSSHYRNNPYNRHFDLEKVMGNHVVTSANQQIINSNQCNPSMLIANPHFESVMGDATHLIGNPPPLGRMMMADCQQIQFVSPDFVDQLPPAFLMNPPFEVSKHIQ